MISARTDAHIHNVIFTVPPTTRAYYIRKMQHIPVASVEAVTIVGTVGAVGALGVVGVTSDNWPAKVRASFLKKSDPTPSSRLR